MAAKKLSFEEKLSRLEEIVAALEKGDAPLADSLRLFEEGSSSAQPTGTALCQSRPHSRANSSVITGRSRLPPERTLYRMAS